MKVKSNKESQEYLVKTVYCKCKRKKVRNAAIFKITDQEIIARIAIDQKLSCLSRVFALGRVTDEDLKEKISKELDTRISISFEEHNRKMRDSKFYRFRHRLQPVYGRFLSVYYRIFYKIES